MKLIKTIKDFENLQTGCLLGYADLTRQKTHKYTTLIAIVALGHIVRGSDGSVSAIHIVRMFALHPGELSLTLAFKDIDIDKTKYDMGFGGDYWFDLDESEAGIHIIAEFI